MTTPAKPVTRDRFTDGLAVWAGLQAAIAGQGRPAAQRLEANGVFDQPPGCVGRDRREPGRRSRGPGVSGWLRKGVM